MILLVSLALGLGSALFPPINIEAYLAGLGALHSGPVLWLAVLATTVGHLAGKLLFYALGRGWLVRDVPRWLRRRHALDVHLPGASAPAPSAEPPGGVAVATAEPLAPSRPQQGALRRRLARWSGASRVEALAGRPWATGLLCLVSSAVGLPPFAIVAVLLGRFRMPVATFLLAGGIGRLARFAVVAGLADAVTG